MTGVSLDSESLLTTYAELTCPYARIITIVFSILTVFVLVSIASVVVLSPPNPSYFVAIMVIVMDTPVVAFLGGNLYLCRRYRQQ